MCLGIIIPNAVGVDMAGWCDRIPQPHVNARLTSQKKKFGILIGKSRKRLPRIYVIKFFVTLQIYVKMIPFINL